MKSIIFIFLLFVANVLFAQVAYDNSIQGAEGTGDATFNITPVGDVRGVILHIIQHVGSTDEVIGATCDGVTMTEVAFSPVLHASGETGALYTYFLGANIPDGILTMAIDVNATGSVKRYCAITLTSTNSAATQVQNVVTINSDAITNPSSSLALSSNICFVSLVGYSGHLTVANMTEFANWTVIAERDFGSQCGAYYRYDIVSNTDVTCGWTQTSEDAIMIAVGVTELPDRKIINQ